MNPVPKKGQRWLWNYHKDSINSDCIVEVMNVDGSGTVRFVYVQLIQSTWNQMLGSVFDVYSRYLDGDYKGIFTYLEGQDKPS